jgi:hypothetical protein
VHGLHDGTAVSELSVTIRDQDGRVARRQARRHTCMVPRFLGIRAEYEDGWMSFASGNTPIYWMCVRYIKELSAHIRLSSWPFQETHIKSFS